MTPDYPKVVGIILARSDSNRLPNKVMRLVNGKTLISYCIERAKRIKGLAKLVLATSDRSVDDELVRHVEDIGLQVFRGSAKNVAKRCFDCAKLFEADYFLRINGDSPFIDENLVREGLNLLLTDHPDLVTNLIERTYPYGISAELVNVNVFGKLLSSLTLEQKEHVTKIFYENPNIFHIKSLVRSGFSLSGIRMVVDEIEDLEDFEVVINKLGVRAITAGYEEVVNIYNSLQKIQ